MTTHTATALRGLAQATFDLSRARQAMLSVAQPALGAILALGGSLPTARVIWLGLIAASAGYLAVFSLNDVLDRRVDAHALTVGKAEVAGYDLDTVFERHPLARGDMTLGAALSWVGGLGLLSAVCAYLLAPVCLAIFALAVLLEIGYCSLRSVTWTKTVVSGLMVAVGGLAGWVAVRPLDARAWPFFAFLALWEIGGRNLPNDLSDLVADSRSGIRTVATVFGPVVSARATAAVSLAAILPLVLAATSPFLGVTSAALAAWSLAVPSLALIDHPTSEQAAAFFNRASLLPALVFAAALLYALVGR